MSQQMIIIATDEERETLYWAKLSDAGLEFEGDSGCWEDWNETSTLQGIIAAIQDTLGLQAPKADEELASAAL